MPPEYLADRQDYGATTVSAAEKLSQRAARLQQPEVVLKFLTDLIVRIEIDHGTQALFSTILDDERSSIACICATWLSLLAGLALPRQRLFRANRDCPGGN